MKNEMGFLIFELTVVNFGQRPFEFSWVLTPAYALHYSFFIFHSYYLSRCPSAIISAVHVLFASARAVLLCQTIRFLPAIYYYAEKGGAGAGSGASSL
jgi:hypothetical protein